MNTFETLEARLRAAFPQGHVLLTSHDHIHFNAVVYDPSFAQLNKLEQHRSVYAAVGDLMGGACHALHIETHTQPLETDHDR